MEKFPQALYRAPGAEVYEGRSFTTRLVRDEEQLQAALADGWHESPADASAAEDAAKAQQGAELQPADAPSPADPAAPARAELEAEATALGVKFRGNTSDETLIERIAAAKAQQGA